MTVSYDKLIEKWSPVLNEESAGKITDHHKKAVTAAKKAGLVKKAMLLQTG